MNGRSPVSVFAVIALIAIALVGGWFMWKRTGPREKVDREKPPPQAAQMQQLRSLMQQQMQDMQNGRRSTPVPGGAPPGGAPGR